jgi:hypothetical protein
MEGTIVGKTNRTKQIVGILGADFAGDGSSLVGECEWATVVDQPTSLHHNDETYEPDDTQ